MLNELGQRTFSLRQNPPGAFRRIRAFPLIHQVVTSVSEEVGGFRKGKDRATSANFRMATPFLFSSAMKRSTRERFANSRHRGAQLLINISNDGWFGTSEAAEQHLRMARVRAVENRRWLVRDTNSGITASIDPYGNDTPRDEARHA